MVSAMRALARSAADARRNAELHQTTATGLMDSWEPEALRRFLEASPGSPLRAQLESRLADVLAENDRLEAAGSAVLGIGDPLPHCDALDEVLAGSPNPHAADLVESAVERCREARDAEDELSGWEAEALPAEIDLATVAALQEVARRAGLDSPRGERAMAEVRRRLAPAFGCTVTAPVPAPTPEPGLITLALIPMADGRTVAGFLDDWSPLSIAGTCSAPPAAFGPTMTIRQTVLVQLDTLVGVAILGEGPSQTALREADVQARLAGLESCELGEFAAHPRYIELPEVVEVQLEPNGDLDLTVRTYESGNASASVAMLNAFLKEFGRQERATVTEFRDHDLMKIAVCITASTRDMLSYPRDEPARELIPDHPGGLPLYLHAPQTRVSRAADTAEGHGSRGPEPAHHRGRQVRQPAPGLPQAPPLRPSRRRPGPLPAQRLAQHHAAGRGRDASSAVRRRRRCSPPLRRRVVHLVKSASARSFATGQTSTTPSFRQRALFATTQIPSINSSARVSKTRSLPWQTAFKSSWEKRRSPS